jgi:hypothetical protein
MNTVRDQQGRFLTGNSGGGRRKGTRNKLTERFLDAVADDFAEYGPATIAILRTRDPATYLKMVGSLVPRELILKREQAPAIDTSNINDGDLAEYVEARRRQLFIDGLVNSIG